jgi:hypothetical protein
VVKHFALTVQRLWRGHVARSNIRRWKAWYTACAVRLQRVWRGHYVRRVVKPWREYERAQAQVIRSYGCMIISSRPFILLLWVAIGTTVALIIDRPDPCPGVTTDLTLVTADLVLLLTTSVSHFTWVNEQMISRLFDECLERHHAKYYPEVSGFADCFPVSVPARHINAEPSLSPR